MVAAGLTFTAMVIHLVIEKIIIEEDIFTMDVLS
jgi:hypothetical protein